MKQILKKVTSLVMKSVLFKNKNIISGAFAFFLILSSMFYTNTLSSKMNTEAHDSEIRFTEKSDNKKILGSIMPASCESYPSVSAPHFNGDTMGTCPETCAAFGRIPGAVNFRECYYWVPEEVTTICGIDGYTGSQVCWPSTVAGYETRLIVPASQSCAATYSTYTLTRIGTVLTLQSCILPPIPTINIQFSPLPVYNDGGGDN